ncbi:hypothetical protein [Nocardia terpenica]|uniref:Holin n=1 Tax=Nocardia terpenica TaxID=455432 RepID=A0A291RC85_9NOCA|nr:hypothetical protein [Nocardia terpenica]ATL65153.1 hypothetical protein CRH09_01805 [Nocardia terpenica]
MGRHSLPEAPSQVRYPWRTVARTLFQLIVGVAAAMPALVGALGLPSSAGVAGALAISAALTRLMAIPAVDDALALVAPWLAAEPGQRSR